MARILVVEDEPLNVEILQRLLARHKHEVTVAGNKQDAIDTAVAEPFDLILMDIQMPNAPGEDKDHEAGLEATRVLKANPSTQAVPIIATTAHAMLDDKKRFLDAGCNDVQNKPYEFPSLIGAINSLLGAPG